MIPSDNPEDPRYMSFSDASTEEEITGMAADTTHLTEWIGKPDANLLDKLDFSNAFRNHGMSDAEITEV